MGWVAVDGDDKLPDCWQIRDGVLSMVQAQVRIGLRSEEEFTTFELSFEWRTAA